LKVALADWFALMVRVQLPVPEQSPDQPENLDLEDAFAVRVTDVPCV